MPLIDVAIPVCNCASHVAAAVGSILAQNQIAQDLGVILVDDGSTDQTWDICQALVAADKRVRAFRNPHNRGIATSLNRCLDLSDARYFARMDADDIALPGRIAAQMAAMERDKFAVCGTAMTLFGAARGRVSCPRSGPDYAAALLFRPPFGHPTAMLDRQRLDRLGLRYSDAGVRRHAEDYGLWIDLFLAGERCGCLGQPWLRYRVHPQSVSRQHLQVQRRNALALSFDFWQALGFTLAPDQRSRLMQAIENPGPPHSDSSSITESLATIRAELAKLLDRSLWGRSEFTGFCTRFFSSPTRLPERLGLLRVLARLDPAGCAAFVWRSKVRSDCF